MIAHGARPTRLNHLDYDYLKSHKLAGIPPSFPADLLTDAGLWMPDQRFSGSYIVDLVTVVLPAEPNGCTNFNQAGIADDLTGTFHNPLDLEAVTHANAKGGIDIRTSLDAARKLGWIKAYYNIRPAGLIDAFDAIRLATLTALPEKRSVSWGTPWFPSWEREAERGNAIMPMPDEWELQNIDQLKWHNSKHAVWKTINGVPYLRNKSWQGDQIGDHGWLYFPREVVNRVMAIPGTVAYTATMEKPGSVQTIDVTIVQLVVSYVRNLFHV